MNVDWGNGIAWFVSQSAKYRGARMDKEYTYHICYKGASTHFVVGSTLEQADSGDVIISDKEEEIVGIIYMSEGISIVRAE